MFFLGGGAGKKKSWEECRSEQSEEEAHALLVSLNQGGDAPHQRGVEAHDHILQLITPYKRHEEDVESEA